MAAIMNMLRHKFKTCYLSTCCPILIAQCLRSVNTIKEVIKKRIKQIDIEMSRDSIYCDLCIIIRKARCCRHRKYANLCQ